nr:glycosyltransferase [uncultured Draconibacterium sp.]
MEKLKILYIAKNIPTPKKKTNRIIFDIAQNVSEFCNIDFLFPKEIVPFWFRNNPRFSYLYKLKEWTFEGFKIQSIPYIKLPFKYMQYWPLYFLPKTVKKYLQTKGQPDLVHAHYLFPDGQIAYRIKKKYDIPYVLTFRNQDKQYIELISPNNPDYKKAQKILSAAKQVLVPNGGYKEFVDSSFNVVCKIMPHGIEDKVFCKEKKSNPKEIIILSVADGLSTKNVDWVINAFKNYTGDNKIKLRLIGDVCKRQDIIELSAEEKQIELLGKVPREDVLQYMKESDIFALPSSKETFGLVYLEAAATGNAIIGFKGEGVWGVFDEHNEMLFCDNFVQFSNLLHRLIKDNELRNKLVQKAFEKAKTMEWSNIRKMYQLIYKSFDILS